MEPPSFADRVDVQVVEVDVVVVDRRGNPVPGLGRDDFVLLVDGEPLAISNFAAYFRHAPEDVSASLANEAPSESPVATATPPAEPGRPGFMAPPVTWLIFADLVDGPRNLRILALRQVTAFLEAHREAGERVLVACFDGDALRILNRPTTDLSDVGAALRRLERMVPARMFHESPLGTIFLESEEEVRRKHAQVRALRQLLATVDGLRGRVALVLVGGGYRFPALEEERGIDPHRARLLGDFQTLFDGLAGSRVTIYSILAGPERFAGAGADLDSTSEPNVADEAAFGAASPEGASTLLALAEETGGLAFVASPVLSRELQRVRERLDGYYSLGFYPPPGPVGDRFAVRVRTTRPDLRVRHRKAVALRTPIARAQGESLAALLASEDSQNPWGVEIAVLSVERGRRRTHRAQVEIRIPLETLLMVEERARHTARLQFSFGVRDPGGNYRAMRPKELEVSVGTAELARLRREGIRYRLELVLSRGSTDFAVTVRDVLRGSSSTARASLDTSPLAGELP